MIVRFHRAGLLCMLSLVVGACRPDVQKALSLSGDNREELVQVLDHYRSEKQKLRAAKYLVAYLPYHYSYELEGYRKYCYALRKEWTSGDSVDEMMKRSMDISGMYRDSVKVVRDVDAVTAEYLIWNIDKSFEMWETNPNLSHLSFEEFCEYVLPHKCLDGQPLTRWKDDWADKYPGELAVLNQLDFFKANARKAAETLTYTYKKLFSGVPRNEEGFQIMPVLDLETAFLRPYDSCVDNAQLGIMTCRSKGIPVSFDFIPNWGHTAGRHYWNVVHSTRRRNEDYEPFRTKPGNKHFQDNPLPKVYRRTYRPNPIFLKILREEGTLPPRLELCSKDVTEEYQRTKDIRIPLAWKNSHRNLCLSVFDNNQWIPVDIAKSTFGSIRFKKVGVGILYAVTRYKDGQNNPVCDPFYLDLKGKILRYNASDREKTSLTLTRKFPALPHIFMSHEVMHGGVIDAGNDPEMSDAKVQVVFPNDSVLACSGMVRDTSAYRYWRIRSSGKEETDMAELFFYERLTGNILKGSGCDVLFDGDPLTWHAVSPGSEPCIDFGRPVSISRVACIRRGDGNDIFPGDEYELYFWQDGSWKYISGQRATDISLHFHDVPLGGLYYIKDMTRGRQNRPFVMDEVKNEVIWY